MAFEQELSLADLNSSNGLVIEGASFSDLAGETVSGIGDFNGDGLDDVIVGAIAAGASNNSDSIGAGYVVFGSASGFGLSGRDTLNVSELDGSNGFTINGINPESFEFNASGAGDVNGDGLSDLIIASPGNDSDGENLSAGYVVFGSTEGFESIDVSALNGTNGFAINGNASDEGFQFSVSRAGDINADGIDDITIAEEKNTYVVFGTAAGFDSSLELSSLDGSNGFSLAGGFDSDGAGDINGDGIDDLVVGGTYFDVNLVLGSAQPFKPRLDNAFDSPDGVITLGSPFANEGFFAPRVSSAGDLNSDGIDDFAVDYSGPLGSDSVYVLFGRDTFGDSFEDDFFSFYDLDGRNGFEISAPGFDYGSFGTSISSAGDINGDGIDDLIIGDTSNGIFSEDSTDESYIVFGKPTGESFDEIAFDGTDGFVIRSTSDDGFGTSVSGAGDVNGDGIDDVIVGAPNIGNGKSYVVFGQAMVPPKPGSEVEKPLKATSVGTPENDGITGTDADDAIRGLAGNDAIDGGKGSDSIDGGGGTDTLIYQFDPAGVVVDLATGLATDGFGDTDTLINIENVIGSDCDDKIKGDDSANSLTGREGNDTLEGGLGDDTLLGGNGADTLIGGAGADSFLYVSAVEGGDAIADFETGQDKLLIVGAVFGGGLTSGGLTNEQFFTGPEATLGAQRFGYNNSTGELLFDADGVGGADAQVLATLSGTPELSNTDITIL